MLAEDATRPPGPSAARRLRALRRPHVLPAPLGRREPAFFARLHGIRKKAARERALEVLGRSASRTPRTSASGLLPRDAEAALGRAGALTPAGAARRRGDARPRPAAARLVHELVRTSRAGDRRALGDAAHRGDPRLRRPGDGSARGRGRVHWKRLRACRRGPVRPHLVASAATAEPASRCRRRFSGASEASPRSPRAATRTTRRVRALARRPRRARRRAGAALERGRQVLSCRDERPEIEEAFIHLTGRRERAAVRAVAVLRPRRRAGEAPGLPPARPPHRAQLPARFVTDWVGLLIQAVTFSFIGHLVHPTRCPRRGRPVATCSSRSSGSRSPDSCRWRSARGRRDPQRADIGTHESLLVTPTSTKTMQLGSVLYDLIFIPIRTALFLVVRGRCSGSTSRRAASCPRSSFWSRCCRSSGASGSRRPGSC